MFIGNENKENKTIVIILFMCEPTYRSTTSSGPIA
jgi:hypothetical protein